ncbi:hypothetical protein BN1002_00114 [Bacillus sp. B-jedd]|nr:hypothetical protein BN1002_00114 [Bacillus sp. B-jedd]
MNTSCQKSNLIKLTNVGSQLDSAVFNAASFITVKDKEVIFDFSRRQAFYRFYIPERREPYDAQLCIEPKVNYR